MCEIAVVDPERTSIEMIHQIAAKFHEEQGDGLGVMLVKDEGDAFDYDVYKSIKPHWQTLYSFLKRGLDDTWRVVIHGRYSTSGCVRRESAHPITVDCDQCEFDYVVHNGSVNSYEDRQMEVVESGHQLNTGVDTEIIPHKIGELPDDIEDHGYNTYDFSGKLNYLVFSEDGIMVRVGRKYDVTDDFLMTCSRTDFDNPEDHGFKFSKTRCLLAEPAGEDGPEIETKDRNTISQRRRNNSSYNGSSYSQSYRNGSGRDRQEEEATDDDRFMVNYKDISEWDTIRVAKVAPGVLRVSEVGTGEVEFVFEDEDPRLYYWYVDESPPDDVNLIDPMVPLDEEPPEQDEDQAQINDFSDDDVKNTVVDETMRVIQENTDTDVDELSEIQDELGEAVDRAAQVAQG